MILHEDVIAGRLSRNAGSFLRKELGGALRNTERFWGDCPAAPSRRLGFFSELVS